MPVQQFTFTRDFTQNQAKIIAAAARLSTPPGQNPPSPNNFLNQAVTDLMRQWRAQIDATDYANRQAALAAASPAVIAQVDAALAVVTQEAQV